MRTQSLNQSLLDQASELSRQVTGRREAVILNFYNFSPCFNQCCGWLGLGVYHTGIESTRRSTCILGSRATRRRLGTSSPKLRLTSSGSKCCWDPQRTVCTRLTRTHQRPYGCSSREEGGIGNRSDLLNFHCNHFSRRFAQMLQVEPVPDYIFSITDFFNLCRCCIPNCILNGRLDWLSSGPEEDYESIQESSHVTFLSDTHH